MLLHPPRFSLDLRQTRRFAGVSLREVRSWLVAMADALGLTGHALSVLLCDDDAMRSLNGQWRNKPRVTDVLSFPQTDARPGAPVPSGLLGDVIICVPQAARQAAERNATLSRELVWLLAHGTLHLLGHDHVHGGRQAARMQREEARLRARVAPLLEGR